MNTFRGKLSKAAPRLRGVAYRLTGDASRVDDLVQDTLFRAWKHRATFEEGTNFVAWTNRILHNAYLSDLRKEKTRKRVDLDDAMHIATKPRQEDHIELADVGALLDEVSPEQREALMLVCVEGFSYEEAARAAGCELGTAKSRVSRGRDRIKALSQSLEERLEAALEVLFASLGEPTE